MKATKTERQIINKARKRDGKKNGVIRWLFDGWGHKGPWTEKRRKRPRYGLDAIPQDDPGTPGAHQRHQ
jgi:hypothetical protein